GLAIYLVFPAITEVLASWPRLSTLNPWWLLAAIGAEIAHFTCTIALQRLALRTRAWFPVITSQLAGNAITLIMPGGAAVGAAVGRRGGATAQELGPAQTPSAGRAERDPSLPAQRHPGGTRQAVVAGAAALRGPPGVRLPVPAAGAAGDRQPPAPLADPGGVR